MIIKQAAIVLNRDGVTFRCPGRMQRPMSQDEQKKAGLIASRNKSVSGREVKSNTGR